jgi:hypothetical protein
VGGSAIRLSVRPGAGGAGGGAMFTVRKFEWF